MSTAPRPEGMRREEGIGSSEVAAALGLNPWRSAWSVWAEKSGLVPPFQGNAATEWGTRLEPVIAAAWSDETGLPVREVRTYQHPVEEWAFASPDRLFSDDDGDAILEVKTASINAASDWGEPGTDAIPRHYRIQVAWQMYVTGIQRAEVAVLIGGSDFRRYVIPHAPTLEAAIASRAKAWWERHIRDGHEPEMTGTASEKAELGALFSETSGEIRNDGPDTDALVDEYREARENAKKWGRLLVLRENTIRRLIGPDEGIEGPGYRITYKHDKRGVRTLRPTFD